LKRVRGKANLKFLRPTKHKIAHNINIAAQFSSSDKSSANNYD